MKITTTKTEKTEVIHEIQDGIHYGFIDDRKEYDAVKFVMIHIKGNDIPIEIIIRFNVGEKGEYSNPRIAIEENLVDPSYTSEYFLIGRENSSIITEAQFQHAWDIARTLITEKYSLYFPKQ